jgi:hypothetical protein
MTSKRDLRMSPFGTLIGHFVRRLFASEEEQGAGGLGLGLGAVLAIVASPGAFASIFLMGKYSTLLQWMRGEHIDAIRRSPSDEYFFIALSMTITGLIMVARWNRLFPDSRDFSNLAILPIPVRNIFLANLVALVGLAVLFGLVVNCVSGVLFPFFVTISIGTAAAFLRVGAGHALAVFTASLFSFFAVFALVGCLSLLLPPRLFRPVSLAARILLVVALLTEFFSNILVQLFAGRLPSGSLNYMQWVPSFWFLGIYERVVGIASARMILIEQRALFALSAAIIVSLGAYALCYRRIFVRLPESLGILAGSRSLLRVRWPEILLKPLFRSPLERACTSFAAKVMQRSEPHLMFFGAYLGVGLVIVAQTALGSQPRPGDHLPGIDDLAIPLLIAFFVESGLRFVFDTPAAREANWLFRVSIDSVQPAPWQIAKRLLLWATLPWELLILAPLSFRAYGWLVAALHVVFVGAFTIVFADLLLLNFRKIPFTCFTQVSIRPLIVKMLGTIFAVLVIVPALAAFERWLLEVPLSFALLGFILAGLWFALARYRNTAAREAAFLQFEDGPGNPFELLNLTSG